MMLGIDIVDLKDPLFKKRGVKSFRLIQNEGDKVIEHPNVYWLLWSAKEAVYKCKREAINFAPKTIQIELSNHHSGEIKFQSAEFEGMFQINDDFILSICSDNLSETNFEIIRSDITITSESIRKQIIAFFDKNFEIGSDDLNLPILLPSKEPISITHHLKMGAFVYPKYLIQ